jgi:hypothetical protein
VTTETRRGSSGGNARAQKLSKEERSAIAKAAAAKRWSKKDVPIDEMKDLPKDAIITGITILNGKPVTVDIEAISDQAGNAFTLANGLHDPKVTTTIITVPPSITASVSEPIIALPYPPKPAPKRKKPMAKEFGKAHSYAEKRLTEAIKERHELNGRLAAVNAEIPSLVQIIRALGGTVDPQYNQIPSYPMQNGNPYQFPTPAYNTAPMPQAMAPQMPQMPPDGIDPALYAANAPTVVGLPPIPKVPMIPNTAMGGVMDLDYVPTPEDEGPGLPRMGGGWV